MEPVDLFGAVKMLGTEAAFYSLDDLASLPVAYTGGVPDSLLIETEQKGSLQ